MNALELADYMDAIGREDAAAMLRAQYEAIKVLQDELHYIAIANPKLWDEEVRDSFQQWAQSRARAALAATESMK
jgi:hypothetical protein